MWCDLCSHFGLWHFGCPNVIFPTWKSGGFGFTSAQVPIGSRGRWAAAGLAPFGPVSYASFARYCELPLWALQTLRFAYWARTGLRSNVSRKSSQDLCVINVCCFITILHGAIQHLSMTSQGSKIMIFKLKQFGVELTKDAFWFKSWLSFTLNTTIYPQI
jgi:hypothetical protein